MSVRMRAALAGAILALGVAPAAEAAKSTSKHHHHKQVEAAKTSKELRNDITALAHVQARAGVPDDRRRERRQPRVRLPGLRRVGPVRAHEAA